MNIMKKRERFIWMTTLSIIIILWVLTETNLIKMGKAKNSLYKNINIFTHILRKVEDSYVERPDLNLLMDGAINGMLGALKDPYTRYMKKEGYDDLKEETKGEFGGVGFVITKRNDQLTVVTPIDDTPASKAGIQPNDIIVQINEESTKNMALDVAVSKMRGKPKTKVKLWIKRPNHDKLLEIDITREKIKIESVFGKIFDYKNKQFGYIKIKTFGEETHDHLLKLLRDYDKKNLDGIILDLRNNPGGLLIAAYKIADLFLNEGMVVETKGRLEDQNKEFPATTTSYCDTIPMALLANGGSASGSEIVIGALKDNKRAILIGTKTFGKGVVQTVTEIDEYSAIAITTARYYTPSGVCIHKKGIKPNVEVKIPPPSKKDINNAEKIIKGKYLDDLVIENKNYLSLDKKKQEEIVKNLIKKLNSDDINADYKLVRKLVKAKYYEISYMNEAILDLEDDIQLKKAAEILDVADRM